MNGSFFLSILDHQQDELKSQAARILGSTDFLGNPLGFVNDVTEGVSGFITEVPNLTQPNLTQPNLT